MIRNKSASAIAVLLTLAFAISLVAIPNANAHTPPWQIPTWAFVQAVVDPVGVGQTTYIYMWIDKTFGTDTALTNDWRFHNYKLTITTPDGATDVKTWDIVWDTTSSQSYSFIPTQVGTYKLKFEFPGQDYTQYSHNPNSAYVNDTFLPSSAEGTLTVQADPIPYQPTAPLPSEYWTRPIYGENPEWWRLASDWLGSGSPQLSTTKNRVYLPGAVGPQTAHIMWTKPLDSGGVVGATSATEIPGDTYFDGSAYINRFVNPLILAGKLFYKEPLAFHSADGGPMVCADLRTGKVLWSRNDVLKPSFGYIEAIHNPQQHGVAQPMLIATSGTNWIVYDGDTGEWRFNFTNVPRGSSANGPDGSYIQYVLTNAGTSSNPNWYLHQWNASRLLFQYPGSTIRPPQTGEYDASLSTYYDWNITIPWRNTMTSNPTVVAAWYGDIMLCYNGTLPNSGFRTSPVIQDPYTYFAVNLNESKGTVGSILWMKTYTPAIPNITVLTAGSDQDLGIFLEKMKETNQWVAYSLRTGDKLWGPVGDQPPLDYYGNPGHERVFAFIAYDNVYASGYGGVIFCYDGLTGDLKWSYGNGGPGNSTNSGFAVPGHYPTSINAIANGILYTVTTEHTIQTPIYKGALCRAINATTGEEVWTLSSNVAEFNEMNYAIADGFATWFNSYDNQIYVVGRGPSVTTITAPNIAAAFGTPIVIQGFVTDTAAGTKQDEQAARFPNGVPAMSDESMTKWMGYVYQQQARPADAVGVEVILSVLDANGNCREIGTATSDSNGFYKLTWTPDIPGDYTVYATFAGTEAYWSSQAQTAFTVMEAEPKEPPVETPQDMAGTYIIYATIAIIATIIVAISVAILILRKR